MSSTAHQTPHALAHEVGPHHEQDAVEAIVPMIHFVLPMVGGVLMLLLAFIAVFLT